MRERRCLALHLHRSLTLFIHPNGTYTSPPTPTSHTRASLMVVFYSSACGSTSPSEIPHNLLLFNRVPERGQARALPHPVNTLRRIGIGQPSPPPSSLSTATIRPFCVQPPEHVDDSAPVFNGYAFNVVFYPSGQFKLLSRCRWEVRRNFEGEGQYWRRTTAVNMCRERSVLGLCSSTITLLPPH